MLIPIANGIKVEYHPRADSGPFLGGPFKIVHHTTEGGFSGSLATLENKHVEPHFLIGATRIIQFIDTDRASKSLVNKSGGVQTNRDGALQLELEGFAAKPKNPAVLANAAALCRILEEHYNIPRVWPNGYPTPYPLPRGVMQNRNATTWDTTSGHYPHSGVPENTHGDPGYTQAEADLVVPPIGGVKVKLVDLVVFGVAPDTLNLRALPNGEIIALVSEGMGLTMLDKQGKWLNVRTADGYEGWVWSAFTKPV